MSKPELKALVRELANIAAEWQEIGIELGFKDGELKNIEADYPRVKDKLRQMLIEWLKRVDPVPSWGAIIEALRSQSVGEMGFKLAKDLEEKYCKSTTSTWDESYTRSDSLRSSISTASSSSNNPLSPNTSSLISPTSSVFSQGPRIGPDKELLDENKVKVESSFAKLLTCVASKLSKKEPPIELLGFHLYLVGLVRCHGDSIPKTSVSDMFEALTSRRLWDYMNYRPLSAIVGEFCGDDKDLKDAVTQFETTRSNFLATETIASYLNSYRAECDQPIPERFFLDTEEYYSELSTKLEITITDQTLDYVDDLWNRIAKRFKLPSLFSVLKFIVEHSIIIIWRIPVESAQQLRLKIAENMADAAQFFETECITQVMIGGVCVFDKEQYDKTEDIPLPPSAGEDEPKEKGEEKSSEMVPEEESQSISDIVTQPIRQFSLWLQGQLLDLVSACKYNSLDAVKIFLEKEEGVDPNMREPDKYAWTPIMWAAKNGNLEIMKLLIKRGADVNAKAKENDWTSLIIASEGGHLEIVRLLLHHNANMNAKTNDKFTALDCALEKGHTEIAKLLTEKMEEEKKSLFGEEIINSIRKMEKHTTEMMKGAREMVTKPFVQFSQWAQRKTLDLVKACRYNSEIEVVEKFLEQEDVNVNMREKSDKYAWTPIMWSAENGNFDVVNLLIERGADVNAKSEENNWTSLIIASRRGHLKIVQLLLHHNAVVDAQTNDQSTALTWALYEGHTEVANLLIEKGANVNNEEENGWTPIIRASNRGLVEMVKPLLDRGAEVNHRANRGWTALMAATNKKHKEVVDVLFDHEDEEKRADPNLAMEDTLEIALHIACYKGYTEIAISLFKAGSNTGARNKDGETPLMVATKRGHRDTQDKLARLQAGQDLNQPLKPFESSVDV